MSKNYLFDQFLNVLTAHFQRSALWFPLATRGLCELDFTGQQPTDNNLALLLQKNPAFNKWLGVFLSNLVESTVLFYDAQDEETVQYINQRRNYCLLKLLTQQTLYRRLSVADISLQVASLLSAIEMAAKHLATTAQGKKIIFLDINWVIQHFDNNPFLNNPVYSVVLLSHDQSILDWSHQVDSSAVVAKIGALEIPLLCTNNVCQFVDAVDLLLHIIYKNYQIDFSQNVILTLAPEFLGGAFNAQRLIAEAYCYLPTILEPELDLTSLHAKIDKTLQQQSLVPLQRELAIDSVILPSNQETELCLLMSGIYKLLLSIPPSEDFSAEAINQLLNNEKTPMAIKVECFRLLRKNNPRYPTVFEPPVLLAHMQALHDLYKQFVYHEETSGIGKHLGGYSFLTQLNMMVSFLVRQIKDDKLTVAFFDFDGTMAAAEAPFNFNGGDIKYWRKLGEHLMADDVTLVSLTTRYPILGCGDHYREIIASDGQLATVFHIFAMIAGQFKAHFISLCQYEIERIRPEVTLKFVLLEDNEVEVMLAERYGVPCIKVPPCSPQASVDDFLALPFVRKLADMLNIRALTSPIICEAASASFVDFSDSLSVKAEEGGSSGFYDKQLSASVSALAARGLAYAATAPLDAEKQDSADDTLPVTHTPFR